MQHRNALLWACKYASLGWKVFPVVEDDDGKRTPRVKWKERATCDIDRVKTWWFQNPDDGIGVVTDQESGIVVLDIDGSTAELEAWIESHLGPIDRDTLTAATAKGIHYYFRCEPPLKRKTGLIQQLLKAGKLQIDARQEYEKLKGTKKDFDILGPGGFVLATPSMGKEWVNWDNEDPLGMIRPAPQWMKDLCLETREVSAPKAKIIHDGNAYMRSAIQRYCSEVSGAPDGNRNNTLYKAAFALGALGVRQKVDRSELETHLLEAAEAAGLESEEAQATIDSGLEGGAQAAQREMAAEAQAEPAMPPTLPDPELLEAAREFDWGDQFASSEFFTEQFRTPEGEQSLVLWGGGVHTYAGDGYILRDETALQGLGLRFLSYLRRQRVLSKNVTPNLASSLITASKPYMTEIESELVPPIRLDGTDLGSHIVACRNGCYHLDAAEFRPHSPNVFQVARIGTEYDPDAECPAFEEWLAQGFDEGSIRVIQEWFGYSLTTDISYQKIFFLMGTPGTGKSVLLKLYTSLLGDESVHTEHVKSLGSKHALQPWLNKLAVIFPDARYGEDPREETFTLERLLQISGGDRVLIEPKYVNPYTARLYCKIVFSSNSMPAFEDDSAALKRRMLPVRMDRKISGPIDRRFAEKMLEELPGILNWSIKGYYRLSRQGEFSHPEMMAEMMAEIEQGIAPFKNLVQDLFEAGSSDDRIPKGTVYEAYRKAAHHRGYKPYGFAQFGRKLKEVFPDLGTTKLVVERSNGAKDRVNAYSGLRWGERG